MPEIDLIATIEVGPDVLPVAAALLLEYADVVREESGNLRFEAFLDRENGAFVVVERYTSKEAFEAHLAHPANAEFNAQLASILGGGGSTLRMLEPLA